MLTPVTGSNKQGAETHAFAMVGVAAAPEAAASVPARNAFAKTAASVSAVR